MAIQVIQEAIEMVNEMVDFFNIDHPNKDLVSKLLEEALGHLYDF